MCVFYNHLLNNPCTCKFMSVPGASLTTMEQMEPKLKLYGSYWIYGKGNRHIIFLLFFFLFYSSLLCPPYSIPYMLMENQHIFSPSAGPRITNQSWDSLCNCSLTLLNFDFFNHSICCILETERNRWLENWPCEMLRLLVLLEDSRKIWKLPNSLKCCGKLWDQVHT